MGLADEILPFGDAEHSRLNGSLRHFYCVDFEEESDVLQISTETFDEDLSSEDREREFWQRAFQNSRLTFQDLAPFRLAAAWRITRCILYNLGHVAYDETLVRTVLPGMWVEPLGMATGATWKRGLDVWLGGGKGKMLSLQPPSPPERFLPTDPAMRSQLAAGYQAGQDQDLCRFVEVVRLLAGDMYLSRGSKKHPELGRWGLLGLTDPETVRFSWPSAGDLIAFEHRIIEETLAAIRDGSPDEAREELQAQYGLKPAEARGMVRCALREARDNWDMDVEEARGLMLTRLDAYISRCKEACALRPELMALKQMTLIMGLGRTEVDDAGNEFLKVVESVASESRQITTEHE